MRVLVLLGVIFTCVSAAFGQQYVPYSYYPPMEYGVEGKETVDVTSNTVFAHVVWGADKDQWYHNFDQNIVELINENIAISYEINSGSLINGQQTFVGGKRKGVFTIKGRAVTDPTSYVDSFWVVDQGSYPVLQDGTSPAITFHVTISPTPPPGGGGGGS